MDDKTRLQRVTFEFDFFTVIIDNRRARWTDRFVIFIPKLAEPIVCTLDQLLDAIEAAKGKKARVSGG